jgi:hypothetical protein
MLPVGQEQTPELQLPPVAQGFAKAPQLATSVLTSVHELAPPSTPAHSVFPVGQVQLPAAQVDPLAQAFPHVPQLATSTLRLAQTAPPPVAALHTVSPDGQLQVSELQVPPVGQAFPQAPQFCASEASVTQSPAQLVCVAGQVVVAVVLLQEAARMRGSRTNAVVRRMGNSLEGSADEPKVQLARISSKWSTSAPGAALPTWPGVPSAMGPLVGPLVTDNFDPRGETG